jgi:hypothetical protein
VVQVQSRGEFVGQFGFKIGPHMINNLIPYMAVLAFPWTVDLPKDVWMYVLLALVVVVYTGVMIWRKSLPMLFLALFAVLNISPLLGFPLDYFNTRYLYLSTISSAIVLASIFEIVWQRVASRRFLEIGVAILVAAVVVMSSSIVVASADGLAEYTRRIRVPFRDVTRLHPTFPPGTYLYFVNSPQTSYWDFEGLFFSRYGNSVQVNATDLGKPADLRAHSLAYVYYFDSTGKPVELAVDPAMAARVTPTLPAQFENDMVLDAYEIPSARLQRGKALVVILNWHAQSKLQDDFTVFAHLIDAQGNRVAEYDNPPGNGKSPTSQWTPHLTFVDAVVLPLSPELPLGGGYRLEIGMYGSQTLQRVSWRDAAGNRNDRVTIDAFEIVDAP